MRRVGSNLVNLTALVIKLMKIWVKREGSVVTQSTTNCLFLLHYLDWAWQNFKAVARHVDHAGRVSPVASVDGIPSRHAADQTSGGQSMTILMHAAWRDCLDAGVCRLSWEEKVRGYFSQRLSSLMRSW